MSNDVVRVAAEGIITVPANSVTGTEIADNSITSAKIVDGAIGNGDINAAAGIDKTKIAGTAVTVADTGTVTNAMLAGSINPSKVTGTAVVNTLVDAKGDLIAASAADTPARLAVGVAGTNPILTPDTTAATGLAWKSHADADVAQASTVGNLLTANQASVETDTTGFTATGGTLARSTTTSLVGSASLAVTATGASLYFFPTKTAVTAGQTYTFLVSAKAGDASASATPYIIWLDGSGAQISEVGGASVTVTSAGWTQMQFTAVAPSGAVDAIGYPYLSPVTAGDVHYFDCFSFHRGAGGLWQSPGVPIPNLGIRANPANATQVQVWNPGNSTWITV